jgi:DNA ligase-1
MKFYDFCLLSENISLIKKRNQIIDILKETFLKLNTEELIIFIELSLGKFENFSKKNLNLGISTIFDAIKELFLNNIPENINVEDFGEWIKEIFIFNKKNEPSNYNLIDIYKEIESYKNLKGEGVKRLRVEKLNKTFKNLSSIEAKYFTKIIIGEIRGGLKEGLFKKALSKFYNIDEKKLNELFLKSGSFRKFIHSLKNGEFKIEVFKPIPMMLAQKVDSIDEIYDKLKNFSLEYKYDGVRVQIHKRRDEVKIFSRNLLDLTENLEDLTDKVKENFNEFNEIILEGELLGFTEHGKNLSFQDLMSVIFRKEKLKKINLNVFLFDILYLNGEDLTNFPLYKRVEILDRVKRDFNRTKYLIPKDKVEAQKFYENSLKEGYEGVMAKDLNGIYQSGRRGKLWLKLKKVETLDLVILKAFWGYGRRVNWLSDYMLYCLSEDKSRFLPLGKTFKGLSDKEFEEVTKRLLEIKEREINGGIMVKPKIVVEVGFDDIQKSKKYESGYALRFARILRFREDKNCFDINTIEDVEKIYKKLHKSK